MVILMYSAFVTETLPKDGKGQQYHDPKTKEKCEQDGVVQIN